MRRFTASDLPALNDWLEGHHLAPTALADLGGIGFVVDGVAAGFLLRTDARRIAILDAFVTNPTAPLRVRHAAIKALVTKLCDEAKGLGVKKVGGFTNSRGMVQVCHALGFSSVDVFEALRKEL